MFQVSSKFIPRPHFACRLREDLHQAIKDRCRALNCSQGVFLEVAIAKVLMSDLVTERDVFQYCSASRSLHSRLEAVLGDSPLPEAKKDQLRRQLSQILSDECA